MENGDGIWYAEHESSYADFFYWTGGQQQGYTGDHFEITTRDGEEVTLKGPWSSRASVVNKAGYGPVMDVVYKQENGRSRPGALTVEKGIEAVEEYLNGVELQEETWYSNEEPRWIPRKADGDTR